MQTKICTKCHIDKELTEFSFRDKTKNTHRGECTVCERTAKKQYRKENRAKLSLMEQQWREKNKEKYRETKRLWEEKNKDRVIERVKTYRANNKEKKAHTDRLYREKNRVILLEKKRQYAAANKDKIAVRSRLYYEANKEQVNSRNKEYYEANKERISEYYRQWRETNQDRIVSYGKQYYIFNRDKILKYVEQYQGVNRDKTTGYKVKYSRTLKGRIASRIGNNIRRARLRNNGGKHTAQDILNLFDQQSGKCPYCQVELSLTKRNSFHVDHVVPLSKGGSNSVENLQLTCPQCNLSKSDKLPEIFAQQAGILL